MKGKFSAAAVAARVREPFAAWLPRAGKWAACFAAGMLFARASVLGSAMPFACSWAAAAPAAFLPAAVLGTLAGIILFSTGTRVLAAATAVVLVAAARWALSEWKQMTGHSLFAPLCAGTAVLVTESLIGGGLFASTPAVTVVCEALLAGGGAWFFARAASSVFRRGGFAAANLQTRAGCAITGGVLLAALSPMEIAGVSVGHVLALMVILFCARKGHVTGGCVSGTAAGTMLALSAGSGGLFPASYAFTGLIAGCFAPLGRFAAAVAMTVSNGIAVMLLKEAPIGALYEVMAASVLYLLIPHALLERLTMIIFQNTEPPSPEMVRKSVVMRLDFASRAIAHVSQSVEEVSRQLLRHSAPSVSGVYDRAVEDTCRTCGLRLLCWEKNYDASMDALNGLTPVLLNQGRVTRSDLPVLLSSVCKRPDRLSESITGHYEDYINNEAAEQRITEIRSVVSSQFRGLSDMLHELSDSFRLRTRCDEKRSQEVRDYLVSIGVAPIGVVCSCDEDEHMSVEICARRTHRDRMDAQKLAVQLEKICGRHFGLPGVTHSGGQARLTFSEQSCYEAESGFAQHICSGAQLCGDHYEFFYDGGGRAIMVLSDGMGSGGRAAVDSAMACGILSRLILSGLGYDCALRIINSSLYVKSGDESLATVDVASIDLHSGHAVFRKAGAAIGFVRRGTKVETIDLASLPAGILQDIRFANGETQLEPGDLVVLVSDGALASGTEWITERIRTWQGDPQALSEELVRASVELRSDGHDDDITAAALRLKSA